MRAFAVRRFGEPPAIQDLPAPTGDDAFLVRVSYAGVNPVDYKLIDRLTATSAYPFVVGIDFSGVLERAPAGRSDLRAGERVFGMARTHGSYAECTAVSIGANAEPVARIPDGVTDEQAAALPIPAITALGSLELLGLTRGERIIVMGATGGVGGYAVQMARARGAHVVATVRKDVDEARRLGAEEVYDTTAGDVAAAIRVTHPGGVQAILDLVNDKEAIRRDAELLAPGGRLVSTVYAADESWFAARDITAHNIGSSANPLASPEGLARVAGMLADGTITTRVGAVETLDGAGKLLDALRAGRVRGKAVIRVGATGPTASGSIS